MLKRGRSDLCGWVRFARRIDRRTCFLAGDASQPVDEAAWRWETRDFAAAARLARVSTDPSPVARHPSPVARATYAVCVFRSSAFRTDGQRRMLCPRHGQRSSAGQRFALKANHVWKKNGGRGGTARSWWTRVSWARDRVSGGAWRSRAGAPSGQDRLVGLVGRTTMRTENDATRTVDVPAAGQVECSRSANVMCGGGVK